MVSSPDKLIGKKCFSREGTQVGTITGLSVCRLEGCRGPRLNVKWADGKRTYPCLRGCTILDDDGNVRIGLESEWTSKNGST